MNEAQNAFLHRMINRLAEGGAACVFRNLDARINQILFTRGQSKNYVMFLVDTSAEGDGSEFGIRCRRAKGVECQAMNVQLAARAWNGLR